MNAPMTKFAIMRANRYQRIRSENKRKFEEATTLNALGVPKWYAGPSGVGVTRLPPEWTGEKQEAV